MCSVISCSQLNSLFPNRHLKMHTLKNASLPVFPLPVNGTPYPPSPPPLCPHTTLLLLFLHTQSFKFCLLCFLSPFSRLHPKYHRLGPRLLCLSPGLWPHLSVCIAAFQSCPLRSTFLYHCQINLSTVHVSTCYPLKLTRLQ